jgi:hypothetical protein
MAIAIITLSHSELFGIEQEFPRVAFMLGQVQTYMKMYNRAGIPDLSPRADVYSVADEVPDIAGLFRNQKIPEVVLRAYYQMFLPEHGELDARTAAYEYVNKQPPFLRFGNTFPLCAPWLNLLGRMKFYDFWDLEKLEEGLKEMQAGFLEGYRTGIERLTQKATETFPSQREKIIKRIVFDRAVCYQAIACGKPDSMTSMHESLAFRFDQRFDTETGRFYPGRWRETAIEHGIHYRCWTFMLEYHYPFVKLFEQWEANRHEVQKRIDAAHHAVLVKKFGLSRAEVYWPAPPLIPDEKLPETESLKVVQTPSQGIAAEGSIPKQESRITISERRIKPFYDEFKEKFAAQHREALLQALLGNAIERPVVWEYEQNQLLELFKRMWYNKVISCRNQKKLREWLVSTFCVRKNDESCTPPTKSSMDNVFSKDLEPNEADRLFTEMFPWQKPDLYKSRKTPMRIGR